MARFTKRAGGKKPEPVEFMEAPGVHEIARQLIGEHHGHLKEARIAYLFRMGKWESRGRVNWGRAYLQGQHNKYLTSADFVIVMNGEVWADATPEIKRAMVDHELSHCEKGESKTGAPRWTKADHDSEEFVGVVGRNGPWAPELKLVIKAAARFEQQPLFKPEAEGGPPQRRVTRIDVEVGPGGRRRWGAKDAGAAVVPGVKAGALVEALNAQEDKRGAAE